LNIEEKLEHLQKASMEEARSQANQTIDDYRGNLSKTFEEHKNAKLRQAKNTIQSETELALHEHNKSLAEAQLGIKKDILNCKSDLMEQLFDTVRERLISYMKTDAYRELLTKWIEESLAYANGTPVRIYINATDERLKAGLETATGAEVTISKEDFFGGMRAVIPSQNILIDHSFSVALKNEYENFHFTGGEYHV